VQFITELYSLFISTLFDVLPIAAIIFGFQFLVIRKPVPHLKKVLFGMFYVLVGVTLFLLGLEQALFPIGRLMASQLTDPDFLESVRLTAGALHWTDYYWVYIFAFAIGASTTIAEPSLIAVAIKASLDNVGAAPDSKGKVRVVTEPGVEAPANLRDNPNVQIEEMPDVAHTADGRLKEEVTSGPADTRRDVDRAVSEYNKKNFFQRALAGEGFKQVTLLGQNVNSYFHDGHDFADLMKAVSAVKGIERIRFTSPHPKDFPDKFLKVMAANPKICKHIHLPAQSGNNRILNIMDRTYTREEFLALVNGRIREKYSQMSLLNDVPQLAST